MKHNSPFIISLSLLILSGTGCAPERRNLLSNSFHNTAAHYNAYYYANERIKEITLFVEENHEWNYNRILPVFAQFDSSLAVSMEEQIDDCIKKASIAIQRHPESKWEDDSYIAVGLAYYYASDFANAITTFKWVNIHSKNDDARHKALVALTRLYVDRGEFKNAVAVSDFMKKEKLNKRNLKNLYLTRAYLYQKREDLNLMVQNLAQAEPLITNHHERARISFITGQVYQQLGFDGEAYSFYKKCLASHPNYELSFYTKLNMAQVSDLTSSSDAKKVRKYFRNLLKDAKNEDFRDKIYYEMANFEIKHGDLEQGIAYYKQSAAVSKKNKRQKSYAYLSLGRIYYDSLAEYKLAKLYYDSTIAVMPEDEPEYEAIKERQATLEDFVTQLTTIQVNDSLLALSELSEEALNLFLDSYIAQKEAEAEEKKKAEEKTRRGKNRPAGDALNNKSAAIGSNNFNDNVWYFYNQSAVSRGRYEFEKIWGNRPLEDNWRRSAKSLQAAESTQQAETDTKAADTKTVSTDDAAPEINREELMAAIPYDEAQKAKLLAEVEHAHYKLGNIYNFSLEEKQNAAETFESLLKRFEHTEYQEEVMYLLYLIYEDLGNAGRAEHYKNILINEHPKSIYAKIILNPNYREESERASGKLKKIYAQAYQMYREGEYKAALQALNQGLAMYPDNDFVDNVNLLKIMLIGKTEDIYKYQYELNSFIRTHTESELLPYADSLVKASERFQIELVNSTRARYVSDFAQPHFFVYSYSTDQSTFDLLWQTFHELDKKLNSSLNIQSLILDGENSMILISEFESKEEARAFNQEVEKINPEDKIQTTGRFYNFVITKNNFDILYSTKELDTYLKFYRKNY